jgi:Lar family restriction alleviation protein
MNESTNHPTADREAEPSVARDVAKAEEIVLRPCPFCGGEAQAAAPIKGIGHYVRCKDCGTTGPFWSMAGPDVNSVTRKRALIFWNTRSNV